MDFNDSPEEASYRAEVKRWLAENAPDHVSQVVDVWNAAAVPVAKKWQARKARDGYGAITWPKDYGGQGGTALQALIFRQEEAKYSVPFGVFGIGLGICIPALMAHGTPAQKERYLRPALFGDEIWCQLFSEPSAGSDVAGLRTRAERQGDEWLINGQKVWTTCAHYADYGFLIARSDPNVPKHKGLTAFVVDMKAPGVEVRPIKQLTGSSNFNEVFFTDLRIPDSMRIDEEGAGWEVAITTLMNERLVISSGEYDTATNAEALLALARSVEDELGPAVRDGAVRERIADWYVQAQGLRYTVYRTLTAMSRGETPGPEYSIGKVVAAKNAQDLEAFGMELQDRAGIIAEEGVEASNPAFQAAFLYRPSARIAGGTDEILRNIIAERVLGLPPDVRVDKTVPFKDLPKGR